MKSNYEREDVPLLCMYLFWFASYLVPTPVLDFLIRYLDFVVGCVYKEVLSKKIVVTFLISWYCCLLVWEVLFIVLVSLRILLNISIGLVLGAEISQPWEDACILWHAPDVWWLTWYQSPARMQNNPTIKFSFNFDSFFNIFVNCLTSWTYKAQIVR